MDKPRFHFRGFPEFLEASARRAGRPDLAGQAGRIEALAALSVLCSQAVEAPPAEAAAILGRAAEFRDQIRIAFDAADAMLSTVARESGIPLDPEPARAPDPAPDGTPKRPRTRRRPPNTEPSPPEVS